MSPKPDGISISSPMSRCARRSRRWPGLPRLPRLEASFDVTRRGRGGLHVVGRVSATVGQTCVVTLEPVENEVDEAIDVAFVSRRSHIASTNSSGEVEVTLEDAPEPLIDGT